MYNERAVALHEERVQAYCEIDQNDESWLLIDLNHRLLTCTILFIVVILFHLIQFILIFGFVITFIKNWKVWEHKSSQPVYVGGALTGKDPPTND